MGVQALGSKNGGHSLHEKPARPVQWRKAHHQRMPIKLEQTVKFIGVIFDKALTWAPYLDHVVARCNNRLNLLKVTAGSRWGASKDVLLIVYKPLIRSLIDYGCIAYDTASQTLTGKYPFQSTQNMLRSNGRYPDSCTSSGMWPTSAST